VPVLIGLGFFVVMFTWRRGWDLYRKLLRETVPPLDEFIAEVSAGKITRVRGTGVCVGGEIDGVPPVLSNLVTRIGVLPERVVLLSMMTTRAPHATAGALEVRDLREGFYKLNVSIGFLDRPNVPGALREAIARFALPIDIDDVTYYLGRQTFVASPAGHMGRKSEWLFAFLIRNARPVTDHLGIPWQRVVEIGSQLDL
jgi:KUP system potassium uptake protein